MHLIENFFYKLQLFLMRKRRTTEVVTEHLIKFHPEDQEKRVLELFRQKMKNLDKPVRRWLILGLGNPGKGYQQSRHNIGFIVLEELAKRKRLSFKESKKLFSAVAFDQNLILVKPLTFMNESGKAVQKIVNYYKVRADNLLAIHDELDLELGDYRLQFGKGPAGHHGVESVVKVLKTKNFWRLRIGIGKPTGLTGADWVLGGLDQKKALAKLEEILLEIEKLCQ